MQKQNIVDTVSSRLKAQQAVSPERRRYLEQLARLMCRNYDPVVNFRNIATARCRHNDGDIQIDVGQKIVDQTVTNLDPDVWSLVAQEGLIVHEIGHVLYTDFDAHERIKNDLGMQEMNAFHDIVWNPAEDAAIEEQLRWKFNCSRELDTYNANLFTRQKDGAKNLPIPQATKIGILEKGCYDAGALDEHMKGERDLVDPQHRDVFDNVIVPEMNEMLADVMTQPDPGVRYERMLEFWEFLKDTMSDEANQNAAQEAQQGQGQGYDDAKPDDTSGMTPGQMADALEDLDEDEVREQLEQIAQPPQQHDWDEILDDGEDADDEADGQGAGGEDAEGDAEADGDNDGPDLGDLFGDADSDEEGAEDAPDEDDGGRGSGGGEDTTDPQDGPEGADSDDSTSEGGDGGDDGDQDGDDDSGGQAGSGGTSQGDDDSQSEYPGHEGHRLVIKD